ncbi:MAG: type II toxin-antitoxin system HigB family toxin [Lentisphaerae bacterium]|nr:type II toxin-antitoxin system HigB family toxin [Lentisphaerota bacterium]
MRVIKKRTLREFWERVPNARPALLAWYAEAQDAAWRTPAEVKAHYGSASIVPGNRVVFNICGNNYRLVVKVHYNTGILYIRFIGSHAEYDKIDATAV